MLYVEARMARKGKAGKSDRSSNRREPSFLFVGVIIFAVVLLGLIVKAVFLPGADQRSLGKLEKILPNQTNSIESMVQLVASDFRCACGQCGELPLVDCDCDLPRGAIEEKLYIRQNLEQGLPAQKVIEMVEGLYGHRIKT
jgi:hypothetical protein